MFINAGENNVAEEAGSRNASRWRQKRHETAQRNGGGSSRTAGRTARAAEKTKRHVRKRRGAERRRQVGVCYKRNERNTRQAAVVITAWQKNAEHENGI